MASEEFHGSGFVHSSAPPSTLPQYPEMIMAAIKALNDKNGSNKSLISKHIEATYGDLPAAHSTLLTHHLNRMRSTGQLLFVKNNYAIPDSSAPPRRGRGRPPKPKTPLPPGTVPQQPRPRGRPPKSAGDPMAPPLPPKPKATSTAGTLSGKKRGRPPKASAGNEATQSQTTKGVPRGRGRPPKVKPVATAPVGA
ncbi:high mobility group A [Striga hermonthica]|uniref:High mobility group A n=1 Tax=Striga hermonthica TaxID=68872 RepID=A0A9N7NLE4_STRHE|nr:high mobility group A [Striga hermonthica]